jgi:hypothetical protein
MPTPTPDVVAMQTESPIPGARAITLAELVR